MERGSLHGAGRRTVFKGGEFAWKVPMMAAMRTHDQVNRRYMDEEAKTAQARTFAEGLEFLDTNHPAGQLVPGRSKNSIRTSRSSATKNTKRTSTVRSTARTHWAATGRPMQR